MRRRNDGVVSRTSLRAGGLAALLALGIAGCNSAPDETQSVQAPLAAGITDQTFRAAAGCPDCTVARRSTVSLPLTGKVFTQVKLTSPSVRGPFAAAVDDKGNAVQAQALLAAEGAARMARQGKLRDDAYARSLTSSSEVVRVSIWADFGDEFVPREQLLADSTLRAAHEAKTKSRLNTATSKVIRWLDAHGFPTYERGIDTPLITADLPTSALTELGHLDGVAIVHLKQPEVPAGTTWFDTVKGSAAQAVVGSVGGMAYCNGEGWQPANYANLPSSQVYDSMAVQNWHTTWTSELISASATTSRRMAPDATLYVAGWIGGSNSLYSAWSWCFGLGIQNMNRSSGIGTGYLPPQADDMAEDYYVYHAPYPLITLAAGNCEDSTGTVIGCGHPSNVMTAYVGNRGFNTLIVGASNGLNTPQTSDDILATFSQYGNPLSTNDDHELPNLVAPGDETVNAYYPNGVQAASTQGRGTSASSPITLGTALLMKTRDSTFYSWPEMMRATIMTASTHPVDGSRTVRTDPGTDLKQGAGLLNANVAVALADPSNQVSGLNNQGTAAGRDGESVNFSSDFPNGLFGPYNITPTINGRLRVVIAWDATAQSCAANGSGCSGVALDADLDLYVSKWNGSSWTQVCHSTSYDSSWELCDLAVLAGSQYKAEVLLNTPSSAGTYLGIAWNTYDPSAE